MISQAILVTITLLLATETNSAPVPMATCSTSCGNLTIPFPFGTSPNCSLDNSFLVTCSHDYNPPKPFLNQGSIEILDISLDGLMKIASSIASDCYDNSGSQINGTISELTLSKFPISSTRNKFTVVGCDTYALVEGSKEWKQMSAGCVSWCDSIDRVVNGASIPKGVKDFLVDIRSFRNGIMVKSFNPCGYAFVVEKEAFESSSSGLKDLWNRKTVPVVLDWSVGNVSCQDARKNLSSFACRATHSECTDSSNGIGYHCKCLTGFQGNPYLIDGCQDIDECIALKPCKGTCTNLQGSYSCSCPKGFEGDGKKEGCHPKRKISGSTLFYISLGFMVPAIGISWIFRWRKQKKVIKLRRNLFDTNGGRLLEDKLSGHETFSIFTSEDLKMATNNYNEQNVLYKEQHFGITYKGMLSDGRIVTILECDARDNIELFINKLITHSQIDHRNVVKLLGCCLETPVPLLVYEFFEFESLHDYILDDDRARYLSWDIRLRIAAETAGALAYMHSVPIIHGSLGSSSILVDHNGYTVKVNNFASNLLDSSSARLYAETLGYMDPEYLKTGALTAKTDVYNFGYVLAELLTGKTEISRIARPEGEHILAPFFLSSNTGEKLLMILDSRLGTHGKIDQLTEVAKVAERCLSNSSVERPTMKEVAIALEYAITRNSSSTTISPDSSQATTVRRIRLQRKVEIVSPKERDQVSTMMGKSAPTAPTGYSALNSAINGVRIRRNKAKVIPNN